MLLLLVAPTPSIGFGLPGWGFAAYGEHPPIQLPDYIRTCKQESNQIDDFQYEGYDEPIQVMPSIVNFMIQLFSVQRRVGNVCIYVSPLFQTLLLFNALIKT